MNTVLILAVVSVVISAYCIFFGIFNQIVVKCLAVVGSILLAFIAVFFYSNSKYNKLPIAIILCLFSFSSFAQNTDSALEAGTKKATQEMVRLKEQGIREINKWTLPPHMLKATVNEFSIKPLIGKKDILIYAMQFVSGAADGMNQALVYHHALAGHSFWDYNTSWKRKYVDYDKGDTRAAFPGAKTWLVGITDGNHLTRMINRSFSLGSVMIAMNESNSWVEIFKKIIICSLINRAGFVLMYDHILK